MTVATMQDTDVLNFIVAGQVRSGTAVIQSAISNSTGGAICHANLFHDDEKIRKACHESYFGRSRVKEYYVPDETSPHRYLARAVFDQTKREEHSVGVRIPYRAIDKLDLYDFLNSRYVEGDFCLVHVVRNPVACFVSLKQAEMTKVWWRSPNEPPDSYIPQSVHLSPHELTNFVRQHEAVQAKLQRACPDALIVQYRDVLYDFQKTMQRVFDFVEQPPAQQALPGSRRLRNRSMRERISNFDSLRREVSHDVRTAMDADDLI